MRLRKTLNILMSFVCATSLLLSVCSFKVFAVTDNTVTATTSVSTVKQGDTAYCYVNIDSLESLAALDVTVHFDPAKVKITGAYNSVSCTLYDSVINTDNIQFSYILDGQGTASKTRLFYFQYQVLSNADIGSAYFDITIGEAYDNSLNEMAVFGSRCSFTIEETVTNMNCSVYGSSSLSTAIEKEFTVSYYFTTYQIASGTAVITYDAELFEVVEVTQGAFLTEKIVDINTDLTGEIYISFVGTEYYPNTSLITVTFRTIKNVTETSKITLKAIELLDKELNAISCSGYATNVNVTYDDTYIFDAPKMFISAEYNNITNKVDAKILLEADSKLGAGDFALNFDPEVLQLTSYEKGFVPNFFNINDKQVINGVLKFSIVSLDDIVSAQTVLYLTFDVLFKDTEQLITIDISGSMIADSLTNSINLNLVDADIRIPKNYTYGDLNGDGNIDILDFITLKKVLIGETVKEGASADLDGNGEINSLDLIVLKKYLLGIKQI